MLIAQALDEPSNDCVASCVTRTSGACKNTLWPNSCGGNLDRRGHMYSTVSKHLTMLGATCRTVACQNDGHMTQGGCGGRGGSSCCASQAWATAAVVASNANLHGASSQRCDVVPLTCRLQAKGGILDLDTSSVLQQAMTTKAALEGAPSATAGTLRVVESRAAIAQRRVLALAALHAQVLAAGGAANKAEGVATVVVEGACLLVTTVDATLLAVWALVHIVSALSPWLRGWRHAPREQSPCGCLELREASAACLVPVHLPQLSLAAVGNVHIAAWAQHLKHLAGAAGSLHIDGALGGGDAHEAVALAAKAKAELLFALEAPEGAMVGLGHAVAAFGLAGSSGAGVLEAPVAVAVALAAMVVAVAGSRGCVGAAR